MSSIGEKKCVSIKPNLTCLESEVDGMVISRISKIVYKNLLLVVGVMQLYFAPLSSLSEFQLNSNRTLIFPQKALVDIWTTPLDLKHQNTYGYVIYLHKSDIKGLGNALGKFLGLLVPIAGAQAHIRTAQHGTYVAPGFAPICMHSRMTQCASLYKAWSRGLDGKDF